MKKILFILLSTIFGLTSYSQSIPINSEDIAQGEKLIEAYFTPLAESFGVGLNNGWYNTAKPHSLGGFDVTITVNAVFIPQSERTFNIKDAGGTTFTSNDAEASTIAGSSDETQMGYFPGGGGDMIDPQLGFIYSTFNMPGGFDTRIMPLPMIQAGIGLIKNTAIDIRYMPMLNVGNDINVDLIGVGAKHDILQWIPGIGDAVPMSLSLQGGYTNLNAKLKIAAQDVTLNTKATTMNLIASKKILMITGYVGVGYNLATTTFTSNPDFDLNGIKFSEKVEVDFESNKNLRANIGLRLNMTLVTMQADYSFAKYPTATLGIGISLR